MLTVRLSFMPVCSEFFNINIKPSECSSIPAILLWLPRYKWKKPGLNIARAKGIY